MVNAIIKSRIKYKMTKTKKYWKGLADLNNSPIVKKLEQNEFVEEIPVDEFLSSDKVSSNSTSRRDFLKFLGLVQRLLH